MSSRGNSLTERVFWRRYRREVESAFLRFLNIRPAVPPLTMMEGKTGNNFISYVGFEQHEMQVRKFQST